MVLNRDRDCADVVSARKEAGWWWMIRPLLPKGLVLGGGLMRGPMTDSRRLIQARIRRKLRNGQHESKIQGLGGAPSRVMEIVRRSTALESPPHSEVMPNDKRTRS